MKPSSDLEKSATPSGGQANVNGVLVQTLIALLDALLGESPCEWLTLEPNLESEKFDLLWKDIQGLHALQVKASVNRFTKATVKRLTQQMRTDAAKELPGVDCRLVLVGDLDKDLDRVEKLNGVTIDPRGMGGQSEKNLDAFNKQAASQLHEFLDRERLGPVKAWYLGALVGHLTTRLLTASTKGKQVTRTKVVADLTRWVTESPHYRENVVIPPVGLKRLEDIVPVLSSYLEKLAEDCRLVTLLGLDPQAGDVTDDTTPELAKIYIQLNTTKTKPSSAKGGHGSFRTASEVRVALPEGRQAEPLPALEALFPNLAPSSSALPVRESQPCSGIWSIPWPGTISTRRKTA